MSKKDRDLYYDSHGVVHPTREKALEAEEGYDRRGSVDVVVKEEKEDKDPK